MEDNIKKSEPKQKQIKKQQVKKTILTSKKKDKIEFDDITLDQQVKKKIINY